VAAARALIRKRAKDLGVSLDDLPGFGDDDDDQDDDTAAATAKVDAVAIRLSQAYPARCLIDPRKLSAAVSALEAPPAPRREPASRYGDGYDIDGPAVALSQADQDEAAAEVGRYLALSATAGRSRTYTSNDGSVGVLGVDATTPGSQTGDPDEIERLSHLQRRLFGSTTRRGLYGGQVTNDSGNRRTRSPDAPGGSEDKSAHGQRGRGPSSSYSGYRGPARVVPNQYSGDRYYG
jgi:hypothetical protein